VKGVGFKAHGIRRTAKDYYKANIEYRNLNIECRSNEFCLFYKKGWFEEKTSLEFLRSAVQDLGINSKIRNLKSKINYGFTGS